MRISALSLVLLATLFTVPNSVCLAQRAQAIGISLHSTGATTNRPATNLGSKRAESDGQSSLGTWVVLGALAGGIAGGVWAGVQIAHSDDPMMANAAIAYVVGVGAVIGGLVGALAYVGFHPQSQGQ
jgi:hypothetical protein